MKHGLDCALTSLSKIGACSCWFRLYKDIYHLGNYDSKNECHWPPLVNFLWSDDLFDVLWNKSKLNTPVYIKPDLI